jgi:acetyl-CoA carboxylase alpha subunit
VSDVVDASLIDIALAGDELLTTDPADLVALARAAAKSVTVIGISA